MTEDKELHKQVRNAIFWAALGSFEETCTFEELSDDGKQVYEDYATAAVGVFEEELAKLRAKVHEMAAKIEAATTNGCLRKANMLGRTGSPENGRNAASGATRRSAEQFADFANWCWEGTSLSLPAS
jgi:hypothetical protein